MTFPDPTPTRVIVSIVTSSRDVNGNCYHFARFYNPAKGRNACVTLEMGSASNAEHLACTLARGDWNATLCFAQTLGKREWQQARKHAKVTLYEGSREARQALADLFGTMSAQWVEGKI